MLTLGDKPRYQHLFINPKHKIALRVPFTFQAGVAESEVKFLTPTLSFQPSQHRLSKICDTDSRHLSITWTKFGCQRFCSN